MREERHCDRAESAEGHWGRRELGGVQVADQFLVGAGLDSLRDEVVQPGGALDWRQPVNLSTVERPGFSRFSMRSRWPTLHERQMTATLV